MSLWLSASGIILGLALVAYGYRELLHRRRTEKLATLDEIDCLPPTIELQVCEQFGWLLEPEVQHSLRELEVFGFVQLGTFRVVEMQGLHIIGLVQIEKRFLASVYADVRGISWIDVSATAADGEVITRSNSLNDELLQTQNTSVKADKSWSIAEVLAQQVEACAGKELLPVRDVAFAELFSRSYALDVERATAEHQNLSRA